MNQNNRIRQNSNQYKKIKNSLFYSAEQYAQRVIDKTIQIYCERLSKIGFNATFLNNVVNIPCIISDYPLVEFQNIQDSNNHTHKRNPRRSN